MRRIINGCYRDFVDTKPCRWEKPKPEKGRKPNWNENQSTSRIEYQGGGNYIHYSLTWCHRQVLCLSLFTLVQRLLKLVRAIWFIKLNQIFSKFTENSFSETLYQLNLLYLKYGVAATQCGLLLCRHGWPIDWSLLCRKYGRAAWGNPDDKLKIHQALKFGRPIIYVMLSNLSDCLLKLIMKVFWALILIVSMRFLVALSLLQY